MKMVVGMASVLVGALSWGCPSAGAQTPAPGAQAPGDAVQTKGRAVSLTPVWTPGQDMRYIFTVRNEQASRWKGDDGVERNETMTTTQTVFLVRRVVSSDANQTKLLLTYERVKVRIEVGSEHLEIDTRDDPEKDADKPMGEIARSVLNKPITVTLDASNAPISVEGNGFTQMNVPTAQGLAGTDVFMQQLRPLYKLPGAPATAGVGRTWALNQRVNMTHMGTVIVNATATLEPGDSDAACNVTYLGETTIAPAIGPAAKPIESKQGPFSAKARWLTSGQLSRWSGDRHLMYLLNAKDGQRDVSNRMLITIEQDEGKPAPPAK